MLYTFLTTGLLWPAFVSAQSISSPSNASATGGGSGATPGAFCGSCTVQEVGVHGFVWYPTVYSVTVATAMVTIRGTETLGSTVIRASTTSDVGPEEPPRMGLIWLTDTIYTYGSTTITSPTPFIIFDKITVQFSTVSGTGSAESCVETSILPPPIVNTGPVPTGWDPYGGLNIGLPPDWLSSGSYNVPTTCTTDFDGVPMANIPVLSLTATSTIIEAPLPDPTSLPAEEPPYTSSLPVQSPPPPPPNPPVSLPNPNPDPTTPPQPGGTSPSLPKPTTFTLPNGVPVVRSSSTVFIGTTPLVPGGPAITISNTPVSLDSDGGTIHIGTSAISLPSAGIDEQVVTVGGMEVTVGKSGEVVLPDGQTISRGGMATVDGTVIEVKSGGGEIVVGGSTVEIGPTAGVGSANGARRIYDISLWWLCSVVVVALMY